MARWQRPPAPQDSPPDYDPELHGTGEGAIREWGRQTIAWLNEHPGMAVDFGDGDGDVLTVLRRQCRLLERLWFGDEAAARMEAARSAPIPDGPPE
jgi:hypothetical protein